MLGLRPHVFGLFAQASSCLLDLETGAQGVLAEALSSAVYQFLGFLHHLSALFPGSRRRACLRSRWCILLPDLVSSLAHCNGGILDALPGASREKANTPPQIVQELLSPFCCRLT